MIGRKISVLRSLPPAERRLALGAWWLLATARVGLHVAPYRSVESFVTRTASAGQSTDPGLAVRAIDRAAGMHPGRVTCLPRALALHGLVTAQGHRSTIRFGVRRAGQGALEAHAWVEVDGVPLGDPGSASATPYAVLEPGSVATARSVPPAGS